ncbi:dynein regulatory complex protein 10-like [Chrysoperla carnea]|uniref:dynein regulatory complex protein 10-like n=1 Tax=Chrysoperla carnea TaxID=189513 RepID=UPI001D073677|nr:dynein regulatory complex protein 10-like [Chrysoperla carnea]
MAKNVLNNDSSTRLRSSLSIMSLLSSHLSDELAGEEDTISLDDNYDFDSNLDKEALWTEHNIRSTEKTRILNIIDDGVNSMSVSLSLEVLMQDKEFLSTQLTENEYKTVIICFENYWKEEKHRHSKVEFSKHVMKNADLCELINILCKKKDICAKARLIVSSHTNYCSIHNAFEDITAFFIKKLNTGIKTERKHDLFLVDVWNKNEKAKRKIQELEMILKRKQRTTSKLIGEKLDYIRSHKGAVHSLKFECVEQIKRNEKKVERRMINEVYESDEVCKKLQEENKRIQDECEILLAQHLKEEKDGRKKNLKIETQLFSWMEKYDLEMMERQDRYDDLNRKYLDEKLLHDEIGQRLDEQQPTYDELMVEKHEYLAKVWNEKYQNFVQNLAAKRIQRFYRQHRKDVLKKRKIAQAQAARLYQTRKGTNPSNKSSKSSKYSKK